LSRVQLDFSSFRCVFVTYNNALHMAIINENKGHPFPYGKHYAVTMYESAWICFHVDNNGKPRSFLLMLTGRLGPVVLSSVMYKPSFETKRRSKVYIKFHVMVCWLIFYCGISQACG
jgi:hypothetical protein